MHLSSSSYLPLTPAHLVLLNHPRNICWGNTNHECPPPFTCYRRKCVIPVVCVKLGKWYVVKHNCVTWGVFNDYIMNNYMFRPVLAIFRLGLPTGLVPIGFQSSSFLAGLALSILWTCPSLWFFVSWWISLYLHLILIYQSPCCFLFSIYCQYWQDEMSSFEFVFQKCVGCFYLLLLKSLSPSPGFNPRTVQPIATCYTDWAICMKKSVCIYIILNMACCGFGLCWPFRW